MIGRGSHHKDLHNVRGFGAGNGAEVYRRTQVVQIASVKIIKQYELLHRSINITHLYMFKIPMIGILNGIMLSSEFY